MILSNVSVPLLGMVDTGVTGHLEHAAYLGAVAVGSALFGFLFVGFNFLRMGTTGIAAQRFGANDDDGLRTSLGQAGIVALLIGLVLLLLQKPVGQFGISLLGPDADVAPLAREYFDIRIWAAPATLLNYALIGWFIGLQNARVPLLIVVTINLINIVLDLLFVLKLEHEGRRRCAGLRHSRMLRSSRRHSRSPCARSASAAAVGAVPSFSIRVRMSRFFR